MSSHSQYQIEQSVGINNPNIAQYILDSESPNARNALSLLKSQCGYYEPTGLALLKTAVEDCRKEIVMAQLPVKFTADSLLQHLVDKKNIEIDGWYISLDEDVIWLTTPYGVDCCVYTVNKASCETIMNQIYKDSHTREF